MSLRKTKKEGKVQQKEFILAPPGAAGSSLWISILGLCFRGFSHSISECQLSGLFLLMVVW